MRIVCISDTHFYPVTKEIPDGDVLIHAGDLTTSGSLTQITKAGDWLASLPHRHKLVIAGNHDFLFEKRYDAALAAIRDGQNGIQYLQEHSTMIGDGSQNLNVYGAPWSVEFQHWAFGLKPGFESRSRWERTPKGIDVLITHGPPKGIMDQAPNGYSLGDDDLLRIVMLREPKLHVFGHIHHSHGIRVINGTTFVNAAICDESYKHTQDPIVLDYKGGKFMQIGKKR